MLRFMELRFKSNVFLRREGVEHQNSCPEGEGRSYHLVDRPGILSPLFRRVNRGQKKENKDHGGEAT